MYNNNERTSFFKKDDRLEDVLTEINAEIESIFKKKLKKKPDFPIVLIMGCARCGSTLLLQWLASLNIFSYPSNLISRFFRNPYFGIRIQQGLIEYDSTNQLDMTSNNRIKFSSSLGKTIGALEPSEFWYFWRQYFKFGEYNILPDSELNFVDTDDFLQKLSAFEMLTGKPLVMKGMMLNWHIPFLYSINPKFIFIDLKRNHFFNAQSLLFAREKFFSNRDKWYSFKPEEHEFLAKREPLAQVAGQVIYTRKAIDKGMGEIPDVNKILLTYEKFCSKPFLLLEELKQKFNLLGYSLNTNNIEKSSLNPIEVRDEIRLKEAEVKKLKNYLIEYENL